MHAGEGRRLSGSLSDHLVDAEGRIQSLEPENRGREQLLSRRRTFSRSSCSATDQDSRCPCVISVVAPFFVLFPGEENETDD